MTFKGKNNWQKNTFSDVITINPKYVIKKGTLSKKVSMQNVPEHSRKIQGYSTTEFTSGAKFKNGDTLFARITPSLENGKTAQVDILNEDEVGFGSTEFYVFRAEEGVTDSNYVYYLSRWDDVREPAIKSMTGTSGRQRVQKQVFDQIILSLPPLNEQKEIANILSSFDNKIENNNKIINNLEEQAQAIFKSWFVDFEPFQDEEFVESELGMIPREWKIANLDDIANYKNGLAMKKYQPNEDEPSLPVLKIKELRNNSTDANSDRCTFNIPGDIKVYDGDIIFSWSASLLIDIWTGGEAGLNQHLFKVTSSNYDKWFYYLWTELFLEEFKAIAKDKATTMGHIKRSHLKESKVLIPTEEQLRKMNEIMNPIIDLIINLGIQSKKLAETRDALLPKLMSGEIRVDEASEVM